MSLVTADGKLCTSTVSPIDSRAASGYHLLAVEGFSRNKTPTGQYIRSRTFLVGGRRWYLEYYPNGYNSKYAGFISVSLGLEEDEDDDADDEQTQPVKVRCKICFIDQFQWDQSVFIHENEIQDFGPNPVSCDRDVIRRSALERSSHLKDDSLIIRCDVIVLDLKEDINAEGGDSNMAPSLIQVPPSDISRHFKDLLLNKEGANVTFEAGGKMFPAHRCVLAARSTVFKAQLSGDIIQGATVKIDGIEVKVFGSMLDFIYTDTLPYIWGWKDLEEETEDESDVEEEDEEPSYRSPKYIMWLLQLLEAAGRYDLHRLKSICQQELTISIHLSIVVDITVLAEQRRSYWLKEQCLEFIKTHTSLQKDFTATEVEEMTRTCNPSVLRKLIRKFAA
ncbi:hypothetical protein ZWY2020_050252 [Hordeum vulgare]|nr:hypothetical protein ZWY2020_050252 [Hordeum vulgare]